jgi:hypothetical protein
MDWSFLETRFRALDTDKTEAFTLPTRLPDQCSAHSPEMAGLAILKHMHDLFIRELDRELVLLIFFRQGVLPA